MPPHVFPHGALPLKAPKRPPPPLPLEASSTPWPPARPVFPDGISGFPPPPLPSYAVSDPMPALLSSNFQNSSFAQLAPDVPLDGSSPSVHDSISPLQPNALVDRKLSGEPCKLDAPATSAVVESLEEVCNFSLSKSESLAETTSVNGDDTTFDDTANEGTASLPDGVLCDGSEILNDSFDGAVINQALKDDGVASVARESPRDARKMQVESSLGKMWEKFRMPDDTGSWWCCDDEQDWFVEGMSSEWKKYRDPNTGTCYWYNDRTAEFFYES